MWRISLLVATNQALALKVRSFVKEFYLSVIYAKCLHTHCRELWATLETIKMVVNGPWI